MYDVIIVGGGPAGLSAALVLGRCRRKVLVVDEGLTRNRWAVHSHNYLSRDGAAPSEILACGRGEIQRYGVELLHGTAVAARRPEEGEAPSAAGRFEIELADGRSFRSRRLILATGVRDVLPEVDGFQAYYGRGIHHCPYCDAWEYSDRRLAAFGAGHAAVGSALGLLTWTRQVTACLDGELIEDQDRARLEKHGVAIRPEKVVRFGGTTGPERQLRQVVFESGPPLPCDGLFFSTAHVQHSHLAFQLGCRTEDDRDEIHTEPKQRTGIPGLFLVGDADGDVQFVIVAAAEGATAAVALNRELQKEDLGD